MTSKELKVFEKETITSREVAELTGKLHKHVIRDIRSILEQGVDGSSFGLVDYSDKKGEKRIMYTMNKKGALILASGYDALLREKIINRLEYLEKQIASFKKLKVESIKARNGLTEEWKKQGCNKPQHYINLTREEYKTLFNDGKKKKENMNEFELAKLNAFEAFQKWQLLEKEEVGYYGCKNEIEKSKVIFGIEGNK